MFSACLNQAAASAVLWFEAHGIFQVGASEMNWIGELSTSVNLPSL